MKTLWSLSCLVFLSASTLAVQIINDIETYKPCFPGSNGCDGEEVCFQYFCYPKSGQETPLRSCKRKEQCKSLGDYKCYKPLPTKGVCVPKEDYETCDGHEGCEGRGGKCCIDYCCNTEYFEALLNKECDENDGDCKEVQNDLVKQEKKSLSCETKEACDKKHTGHKCCLDNPLLVNVTLSDKIQNWEGAKRCCMSGTSTRQINDLIPKLKGDDVVKIDEELAKQPNKRDLCNEYKEIPALKDKFETCKEVQEVQVQDDAKEKALEEVQTAANNAKTAAQEAKNHMEAAKTAKIAAEKAKNITQTSENIDEVKNANATAQLEAKKANTSAIEAGNEAVKADKAKTKVENAANEAKLNTTLIADANRYAEDARSHSEKAQEFATNAKTAAEAAQTAADKKVAKSLEPPHEDPEKARIESSDQSSGNAISSSTVGFIGTLIIYFSILPAVLP